MKKLLLVNFTMLLMSCNGQKENDMFKAGDFFPNVIHGITFLNENNQAFFFRIGFLNSEGENLRKFNHHRDLYDDYSGQKYGPSARLWLIVGLMKVPEKIITIGQVIELY